jgi:hypothetical protein
MARIQASNKISGKRQTVLLDVKQHRELATISRDNDVSVSWIVRHAVERLVRDYKNKKLKLQFTESKEEN